MSDDFDVFLCHKNSDQSAVRELAEALEQRGLKVWLADRELIPGRPWQEGLEVAIQSTRSVAVLVGRDGQGPWQEVETRAALSRGVERGKPVIPVLLPGVVAEPELPLFLRAYTWVDFRGGFDAADKAEDPKIAFIRAIRAWAESYGLSVESAQAEIETWPRRSKRRQAVTSASSAWRHMPNSNSKEQPDTLARPPPRTSASWRSSKRAK
jgi:hypothetical protein